MKLFVFFNGVLYSISTIRFTTPIRKVRGYQSYHHFAKKFYREVFERDDLTIPPYVYFHCFSMNGCSTFTALWDLLDSRKDGDEFKQRVQGLLFDSSPAFTTPAQNAHAISFASMPPQRCHAIFRESYRALLYAYFSIHNGLIWIWSFMENDIYEKCYAYYRMLSQKDLPKRQIYFYGPSDDVSFTYQRILHTNSKAYKVLAVKAPPGPVSVIFVINMLTYHLCQLPAP
ncbi:unnamed protein product [Cylicostephanus goldi]|uniref:Uncharacterized protein n=1 Tax=Cylicostephanus goldi TaxID=71465 RepID=A0A3P6TGC0_CYLGO|nr:unnamed protein product [Cylicostephanus goldi]